MKRTLALLLLLAGSSATAAGAAGWGSLDEAGTSGATWLAQPSSARVLGLGGAGAASASGVEGWAWNPAAPAAYPFFNAELSWRRYLMDSELGFLSASQPTGWGVPSVGLTWVQTGGISGYDDSGQPTGDLTLSDLAMKLGWARTWSKFSAGCAVTYLRQDFGTARSTGWGVDLGLLAELLPGVRLGASALRLGQTQENDPLPAEVRIGASAQLAPAVLLALDVASPRDADIYVAAGAEWRPVGPLAVRAGWRTGPASGAELGTLAYFSAGLGLAWDNFHLDYAFEPAGVLGDVHHLSLGYRWGEVQPAAGTTRTAEAPAPPAPHLQVLPRAYEGRMVITPKAAVRDLKTKSVQFRVRDAEGKIVRTFVYAGQMAPKELVWDGKDNQGRLVDQDQLYSFDYEYATAQGVRTEAFVWPQVLPARKLWFLQGGVGLYPDATFRFEGARDQIRSWRLTIADREQRVPVREITGAGALPASLVWDGRDAAGAWASPAVRYLYQLELISQDYARVVIEHNVIAVPASELGRTPGRVRFKILRILFDFARATIRAEMADKMEKAIELSQRGGTVMAAQGHADETGGAHANEVLSARRAETVLKYLVKHGVAGADAIAVEGFGNSRPLVTGGGETGQAQNRRVEIVLDVPDPAAAPAAVSKR